MPSSDAGDRIAGVAKCFSSRKREGGDFLATCVSPKGDWIYCEGEEQNIYCFSHRSGNLDHLMKVHDKDVIGVIHQPHINLVITYGEDCSMKLWKNLMVWGQFQLLAAIL